MPLIASRRPRSSRHDIVQSQFTSFLSLHRLKNFRTVMKQKQCDAFLIILGVDSKFSTGCLHAASYLLFDVFETRKGDINRSRMDLDIFEDVIICIQNCETHVYCNNVNYLLLLPYISHWPNLRIHCVSDGEMSNLDKYEEFKMTTFERITEGCKRIAVPYGDWHGAGQFSKMLIEDWPIVQSYAFDSKNQCSREFFTLSREVVDVSREVQQLSQRLDPVYIESFVVRSLLSFTGTFEAIFRLLDSHIESATSFDALQLLEPLLTFYIHSSSTNEENSKLLSPYLLFGQDTTKNNATAEATGRKASELVDLAQTTHMIIRGCAQNPGLVCERTHFFQQPNPQGDFQKTQAKNTKRLIRIYLTLLRILWDVVGEMKKTNTQFDSVVLKAQEALTYGLKSETHGGVEVKLTYPSKSPSSCVRLAVLSGAVYDIMGENKVVLGSLVAADTLIISSLKMNRVLLSRNVINLTAGVQHVYLWTPSSAPFDVTNFTDDHRAPVFDEQLDAVNSPMNAPSILPVNCAVSDDYIILHGQRIGCCRVKPTTIFHFRPVDVEKPELLEIVLPYKTGGKRMFDQNMSPAIQLTLLDCSTSCINAQPETNDNTEGTSEVSGTVQYKSIWLLLKPRTRAKRLFLDQVSPLWRSKSLIQQAEHPPTLQAAQACTLAVHLNHDGFFSSSPMDLQGWNLERLSIENQSPSRKFTLNQLMTHQPSNEAWLQIHRADLQHIEASWCLDTISLAGSPLEYAIRCGVFPNPNKEWRFVEFFDYADIIRTHLEHVPEDQGSRSSWMLASRPDEQSESELEQNDASRPFSPTTAQFEPLILTVICGPVGSRKDVVVKNLMEMVKEDMHWICIKPPTVSDFPAALRSAVHERQEVQLTTRDRRLRFRGIVLCPDVSGSREVLAALAQLCSEDGNCQQLPPLKIGCVATCIDNRGVLMDNGRFTFPGVLDLISEGWTNYLLQTGPTKAKQMASTRMGVQIEEVDRLLRSVNPRLSQLAAPDGHIGHGHTLEALLDDTAFEDPTMQRARLLSHPNLIATPSGPKFFVITLKFAREIERVRFNNCLKTLFSKIKPWPFYGNIYELYGQVGFVGEPGKIYDVFHVTLSGITRISAIFTPEEHRSQDNKPYWLTGTIAGPKSAEKEDALATQFANWLRQAAPQQERPRPPLRLSDLTSDDLEKIHEKYHLHPLPPGWYYTGVYYVNMKGEKSFQHPNIDAFIAEYIEGENTKISARNARLASHPVPDLFSDPN
ncbi:unnamed protein product [Calicophoron daubneyi]|uniref:Uncharacterized protein n=1 Tax=Calicophoron daubneyi TaxID=300641 RepID=A0AAV2TB58_CALDB